MIFLIEQYKRNRAAKIRAWKAEGEAWVKSKNDQYGYYTMRDWEVNHPYPVVKWGNLGFPIFLICIFTFTIVGLGVIIFNHDDSDSGKETGTSQQKTCDTTVKKGDKVGVGYGSFKGSKGIVIRQTDRCAVDITLTESTNSFDDCTKLLEQQGDEDSNCSGTLNNGSVLHIKSSDNVVPL